MKVKALDPCRPCDRDKELARKINKLPGMGGVPKLPQYPMKIPSFQPLPKKPLPLK